MRRMIDSVAVGGCEINVINKAYSCILGLGGINVGIHSCPENFIADKSTDTCVGR